MLEVYGVPCERRGGHAAAYALLEAACRRLTGAAMPEVARTEWGKPYFADGNLRFSLSHTRTMAVCAVSEQEVGVDAESIRPLRPGVAERCLTEAELRWMEAQEAREMAFFRLWTAKEAWTKLIGTGLQGRPKAVDLREAAARVHFESRVHLGAVVTVCTETPARVEWRFRAR